jgi:predicted NAD-dependent protein-ADP-ribosyltransferase YbiA (DUF1768 family)
MELYPAEITRIRSIVDQWVANPAQELEATFGLDGSVSASTFLQIAQRLVTKGYEALPQDDRLTILMDRSTIRLSLQGLGVLQSYCRDDKLQGKPFVAMRKHRTTDVATVDLEEYETRIKMRHEEVLDASDPEVTELLASWPQANKAFRLIKRWTFRGDGMRIDMSMVRSTPTNPQGQYKWQRTFMSRNPFKEPVRYEVEVELLRDASTDTAEKATKVLFRGVGEILRAIQKNSLLIRNSIKSRVLADYTAMNGSDRFRGVSPKAIVVENMLKEPVPGMENIRDNYNVTDKADGTRCLGYCDEKGELFLIDMGLTVYRTGLQSAKCAQSLVDGEWVTHDADRNAINHFKIFEIYQAPKALVVENIWNLPFEDTANPTNPSRYKFLRQWMKDWSEGQKVVGRGVTDDTILNISLKEFIFAAADAPDSIFLACDMMLKKKQLYYTDGLILTSNMSPLPKDSGAIFNHQFKWKPAKDNSIDFLVAFEKDADNPLLDKVLAGIHPVTGEEVRYKTLRLYVSSYQSEDPRTVVLNDLSLVHDKKGGKRQRRAVLFNPVDYPDTMASVCYIPVQMDAESGEDYVVTADTKEPIRDKSILEMRYDVNQGAGWRWVPMRVRHDKTERLLRNPQNLARTMNSDEVANITWTSIHYPITESMIRTGNEEPTLEEMEEQKLVRKESGTAGAAVKYFEREMVDNWSLARGLRDFHNKYIKEELLYRPTLAGGNKKVLDLAVGEAADLFRWQRGRAQFVLGIDPAGESIRGPQRGAYARYVKMLEKVGRDRAPDAFFVIGDSSKSLVNGDAGATVEEGDILRTVFGQAEPQGIVPKAIESRAKAILRSGADVATCMFALHYFFANREMLEGFLKNLQDCVKVGGYFAGCCFDGREVFNLLRSTTTGHAVVGNDESGKMLWSIKKSYETEDLPADDSSIGHAIDVTFASIGMEHREYLVNFDYFTRRLQEIGFEHLNAEELRAAGLKQSTNLFGASYEMARKGRILFPMTDTEKKFSFLNRWFLFKRRAPEVATIAVANAVANAAVDAVATMETGAGAGPALAPLGIEMEAPAAGVGAAVAAAPVKERRAALEFGANIKTAPTLKIPSWKKKSNPLWWLAPSAFFTIVDDDGANYPSLEHYWMAMKIKHASNKPDLAAMMGSTTGIHLKYEGLRRSRAAAAGGALTAAEEHELEMEEIAEVLKGPSKLGKAGIKYDEEKWARIREEYLRKGLAYRWAKDADFRAIVEAARGRELLLVYKQTATSDLGGRASREGIKGGNLIGRIVMELAGYTL